MLLVYDVGNTNIKIGLMRGKLLVARLRVSSKTERTADEHYLILLQFLEVRGFSLDDIRGVMISSVVPVISGELCQCMELLLKKDYLLLGPGVKTGLKIRTEQPQELGADLVANAVGAYHLSGKQAAVAIAFGTASTFTCIGPAGELLGVSIAPGIETTLEALVGKTALLKQVQMEVPKQAIGRNTKEALQSGLVLGTLGAIEYIAESIREEIYQQFEGCSNVNFISTGYFASLLQGYSPFLENYQEDLLFLGLAEIWQKNFEG